MNDYAQRKRSTQKHLLGLSAVIVLHVLVLWAINSGLAHRFVKFAKAPVEAVLLEETPPDIPPPPPPPPPPPQNLPPPPPAYVPPVEVQVSTPPPVNAIAAVSSKPQAEAPPSPLPVASTPAQVALPSTPVRTAAVISAASCEKPDYPSASRRLEEEGTVTLKFLVGADGKVKESAVDKSSGFRRLDEAARQGLAKCLFKPGTENGQPVEGWAGIKYTWKLE
jgi:protein TonB